MTVYRNHTEISQTCNFGGEFAVLLAVRFVVVIAIIIGRC
jgi:hypothetical protein